MLFEAPVDSGPLTLNLPGLDSIELSAPIETPFPELPQHSFTMSLTSREGAGIYQAYPVDTPPDTPETEAAAGAETPTPITPEEPTATPVPLEPITPGEWTGEAEFGTFVMTVNPDGTGVPYIAMTFSAYACDGRTISGGLAIGDPEGEGVPITDGQFTFSNPGATFEGIFDATGTNASGTWRHAGCSGIWEATAPAAATAIETATPVPEEPGESLVTTPKINRFKQR